MNIKHMPSGFTLIELMITILILVVIITISAPHFSSIFALIESKKVSTTIQTVLRESRDYAFSHRKRIAICGSHNGITCDEQAWGMGLLVFHDKTSNRIRDPHEDIYQFLHFDLKYGNLNWKGFGIGGNIVFQPDTGLPRGSNGSFYYCANLSENTRRIVVSPMGHSRIEPHQC
ncbi:GspH/FimT family protein [Acinetobacter puyangensis]|nr:GspH/FimT family protein [Acinetobacter puyangensis]